MGFGIDVGARGAEQGAAGPGERLDHRSVGRRLAQRPYLVDLCGRDVGVHLLELLAVVFLEPGPQLLAHAG